MLTLNTTQVLERELAYSSRDSKGFGDAHNGSSLSRVLASYTKLVAGLLEELDLVQWAENEIMVQEASWVANAIQNLASGVSDDVALSVAQCRVPS